MFVRNMGLQEQLLSEQVGLLFVSGHTCVENDLTTAGFFFLIDEVALDAAWVKETLVAWSPDRDIIRPSTEDGPGDTKGIGDPANFTLVAIHGILIFYT